MNNFSKLMIWVALLWSHLCYVFQLPQDETRQKKADRKLTCILLLFVSISQERVSGSIWSW